MPPTHFDLCSTCRLLFVDYLIYFISYLVMFFTLLYTISSFNDPKKRQLLKSIQGKGENADNQRFLPFPIILCPCIDRSGAHCFGPIVLSVRPSVRLFVRENFYIGHSF